MLRSRPAFRRTARAGTTLAVAVVTALVAWTGQSTAAPTTLTLNGGIFAPFGGGPFGTIDSDCSPGGSPGSYFQSSAFLTTTLPDGFGTGSVSTSGTLAYGPTSGGPPGSIQSAQVVSASPGPMVMESPAGRADVTFSGVTPFSNRQSCAVYDNTDLSAGPYSDGSFASGCTASARTSVDGFDRGMGFFGAYEAVIVPTNGDGPVIERGTFTLVASHRSLRCDNGSSAAAAFSVSFRTTEREPLDEAPPTVIGVPDRPANGNGWYDGDVVIDWQATDPAPSSGSPSDPPNTTASQEGTHVYTSAPSCDPAGNCATGSLALSIDKTDPTVGIPALSPNPKAIGETADVSAAVADNLSGVVAGEYYLDSDPGEGNGSTMSLSGGSLSATIGTNLATGVYRLCVRARDAADNWSDASCAFLVVYDASAGFATGGGWFVPGSASSDAGDLLPGLDGASKANFGFVVKYQNGSSTVPNGQLEFHYNVGNFHLHSAGMDWLVVTNSNWAKFQGLAEIDGASGAYPFRVDARDGDDASQTDRFVIKIWAPGANPDVDAPIYKASGDVSGQIKIHR